MISILQYIVLVITIIQVLCMITGLIKGIITNDWSFFKAALGIDEN